MIGEIGFNKSGALVVIVPRSQLAELDEPIPLGLMGRGTLCPFAPLHIAKKLMRLPLALNPISPIQASKFGFSFLSELLDLPKELEELCSPIVPIHLVEEKKPKSRTLSEHFLSSVIPSKPSSIQIFDKKVNKYRYVRIGNQAVSWIETDTGGIQTIILLGSSDTHMCYFGTGTRNGKPVHFLIVRIQDIEACKKFFKSSLNVEIEHIWKQDLDTFTDNMQLLISDNDNER
jgi:hypothetical protein